jgi:hypothetical protein
MMIIAKKTVSCKPNFKGNNPLKKGKARLQQIHVAAEGLIDFNGYFTVVPGRRRPHHNADRFGDAALFADYSAHVVFRNMQVKYNRSFFIRFVDIDAHGGRVINKALRDGQ